MGAWRAGRVSALRLGWLVALAQQPGKALADDAVEGAQAIVDAATRGGDVTIEDRGDLLVAVGEVVAQRQRLALLPGQRRQRLANRRARSPVSSQASRSALVS
jgi:hypothetical protein